MAKPNGLDPWCLPESIECTADWPCDNALPMRKVRFGRMVQIHICPKLLPGAKCPRSWKEHLVDHDPYAATSVAFPGVAVEPDGGSARLTFTSTVRRLADPDRPFEEDEDWAPTTAPNNTPPWVTDWQPMFPTGSKVSEMGQGQKSDRLSAKHKRACGAIGPGRFHFQVED